MGLVSGKAGFLAKAQETLEGLFPGVLVIDGGDDLACARTGEQLRFAGAMGGDESEEEVTIRIRTELIGEDDLTRGNVVVLDGKALRVENATLEPGDVAWNVELLSLG